MIRGSTLTVAALCAWSFGLTHASQGVAPAAPPVQGPATSPAPALKALVPAAVSSIAAAPHAFTGQTVSVTASVDRVLSPTSFILDQNVKTSGEGEVVVIAGHLNAPLQLDAYVTVIGDVVFEEGRPAIRATAVIDSAMIDLTRRLPPPTTADEEAFDALMKRISRAFNASRQGLSAEGAPAVQASAAELRRAFGEAEAFWKKRDKPDALKWTADARTQADVLERTAAGGQWNEAKAAATALQQACSACHAAYRARQDDGSYRIR